VADKWRPSAGKHGDRWQKAQIVAALQTSNSQTEGNHAGRCGQAFPIGKRAKKHISAMSQGIEWRPQELELK
jgi:hypothetical protein